MEKRCSAGVCGELVSSPCENTCPAGINIPGYMSLIATGDYMGAARIMLRDNRSPASAAVSAPIPARAAAAAAVWMKP